MPRKIIKKEPVAEPVAPEAVPADAPPPAKKESSFIEKMNNFLASYGTVPIGEKIFFVDNLRVMVKAGLSLAEGLATLAIQTKNKKFSKIIAEIEQGVTSGNALGAELEKHPKIFPAFFINMVKAGEVSGNLEKNLEELAIQMKKDHDLTSKVRGAMMYPIVIIAATIGISILMFVYVIPSVLSIFEEMKVNLPLSTRILIAVSHIVSRYGLFVALGFIAAVAGIIAVIRNPKGKKIAHSLLLKLFIIGPIIKKINLARFARTLSSLLKTDIPVIESFKITSSVLGNVFYKSAATEVSAELSRGVAINAVLSKYPALFPPVVTQMIFVGEKSGTLDALLGELAIFYEKEVDDITKNLATIIEPIIIIFLGGVVALIAFAIISPIYTLSQNI